MPPHHASEDLAGRGFGIEDPPRRDRAEDARDPDNAQLFVDFYLGKRFVSIADAMRQGGVDRIEQEKTEAPHDQLRAHNTHSAVRQDRS